jgi:hypothetical protein
MNLAQLRARIKNQLDYTPVPSAPLSRYLDSVINDAYMEIWMRRPYMFNIKEVDLRIFKDFLNSDVLNAGGTIGENTLTFTHGSDVAQFNAAFVDPSTDQDATAKFIGAFVKDNTAGVYYRIENVLSNLVIKLDRPYEGTTVASTSFTIIHRFAYMPDDLIEVMDISFPNFPINATSRAGKIHGIPRRIDVDIDLSQDLTTNGRPNFYVSYSKEWVGEIENTLSLSAAGAGSLLPDNTYYFAYTVVAADGSESGFSDIASVTTSSNDTISITFDQTIGNPDLTAKYRYNVYWARKKADENEFIFYKIGTLNDYLDDTTVASVTFNQTILNNVKQGEYSESRWNESAGIKKVRFHPRPVVVDKSFTVGGEDIPTEVTFFHLRYLWKPLDLSSDYDVPHLPSEFHHLIIDKALVDIYAKYDNINASRAAEKRFNDRVRALDARYAGDRDIVLQRAQTMSWGSDKWSRLYPNRTLIYRG